MKLYTCKMLDESLDDWKDCVIAVLESEVEQNTYCSEKEKYGSSTIREKLLIESGYIESYDIEFWFPYELEDHHYAKAISQNIPQFVCDTDYAYFELIEPHTKKEIVE